VLLFYVPSMSYLPALLGAFVSSGGHVVPPLTADFTRRVLQRILPLAPITLVGTVTRSAIPVRELQLR